MATSQPGTQAGAPPSAQSELASATETASQTSTVNIGTRKSLLARIQADLVRDSLKEAWPSKSYEIHAMSTMGDKNQIVALHNFGAKSLWTHELEAGLLEGTLDLIVHCVKDMPTQLPPTLRLGAILKREDPRDCLVMKPSLAAQYTSLASLPAGSIVGTSSVRRSAQIASQYPHLKFADVRGNVGTRLSKLDDPAGEYSCLILAAAGLLRLGLADRITQYLDSRNGGMLYAVGQGALGIEVREGDDKVLDLLAPVAHLPTTLACLAERSLMRTLEGGCSVPIGVETEWGGNNNNNNNNKAVNTEDANNDNKRSSNADDETDDETLTMRARVVSLDGSQAVNAASSAPVRTVVEADAFGRHVAQLLIEKGAGQILEKINLNRGIVDA
ncbi:MAG: hypothetical protein M1819_000382 [Sarea resinae]|nr:MAG: hypothetical protein M1819_000382 [Sarea resinae]